MIKITLEVFTTGDELREIADLLDRHAAAAKTGQSAAITRQLFAKCSDGIIAAVQFAIDQDRYGR